MKNRKLDIRPYTKQFYKGNVVYFIFALCENANEAPLSAKKCPLPKVRASLAV